MARREEFQLSFLASTMKEFNNDKNALPDDKSLNVSRLLLWAYQVTHIIPNSIDNIRYPIRLCISKTNNLLMHRLQVAWSSWEDVTYIMVT